MRLVWSAEALNDLRRITAFYRAIDPELSIDMRRRIQRSAVQLTHKRSVGSPTGQSGALKWRLPDTPIIVTFERRSKVVTIKSAHHYRENWRVLD